MGKINLRRSLKTVTTDGNEEELFLLDNKQFDRFNPQLLGLGDITLPSTQVEAVAAVFDLSGFTNFCSQIDPHLSVPEYLSGFLEWLFDEIKKSVVEKSYPEGKKLWTDVPFLGKFLGDGVLFLWESSALSEIGICNIVTLLSKICAAYKNKLYPQIKKTVVEPPSILRCGVARGRVFSVGDGNDYVGPCINIASRLQKLSLLTFCVSRRGFDFEKHMHKTALQRYFLKSVSLRGIGDGELVWVRKDEFEALPKEEKALFKNP